MNSTIGAQRARRIDSPRVLAYCHDGVGLGHLRRTLNICQHLGASHSRATFLVTTGSPYVSLFEAVPRLDYLKLPSLSKLDNRRYRSKFLSLASKQILKCREALLLETVRHFAPHIVLIDKAPLGVCGELVPSVRWIRRNLPRTRIVFGMRDIEDDAEATIEQWSRLGVQSMLEDCFDEVWVYGMRSVFDVAAEYRLSERIRAKLRFTGYVARTTCDHGESLRKDEKTTALGKRPKRVLVTVGGGTDGTALLETYLAGVAARAAGLGIESVIVAGPDLPPDSGRLLAEKAADIPNVEWVDFVPCMTCRMKEADLVVCMGGYNTLCEVARSRKPALVIPRVKPRVEQAIRANLWAKRGVVSVLPPAELTPCNLGDRVIELLERGREWVTPDLNLRGLDTVRERFGALLNGGIGHAIAVSV